MALATAGAGRKARVLPRRGDTPPLFMFGDGKMRELSIFIDEVGDFGPYVLHSPYYIVTLVFHDQSIDISADIDRFNSEIRVCGLPDYTVHAGPLIRREREYLHMNLQERKRIFNRLYNFARVTEITYHTIIVEKRQLDEEMDLTIRITKQLSAFLRSHLETFTKYDRIVAYYDYGQRDLTRSLASVFNTVLNSVEFRKIEPAKYKLFQVADMLCTLELLSLKMERKALTKSELTFFKSAKDLYKSYLRAVQKKRFR